MKIRHISALVVLALLCSAVAFADTISDPTIIIHGVQGGGFGKCPPEGCRQVGMTFQFNSPEKGFGRLFFTNASGRNWTSLKLIENGVSAANISCVQSLFLSCKVMTLNNGSVEILLSGVHHGLNPHNGIPAGSSFSISFGCKQGQCWPKGGLLFSAQAGAAPEPATVALMLTGVGAIFSRRKLWNRS